MATSYEISGSNLFHSNDENNSIIGNTKTNLNTVLLTGLSALYLTSNVKNHINFDYISNQLSAHLQSESAVSKTFNNEYFNTNTMKNGIVSIYNSVEEEFVMSSNYVTDKELSQIEKYFDAKLNTTDVKIDNLQSSINKIEEKIDLLATKADIAHSEEKMKNEMHKKLWTLILAIPTLILVAQFILSLIE